MPTRQKQLLIALVVAVLTWQGGGWAWQWVFGPITRLRDDRDKIQARVDAKTDQVIAIERARAKLRSWQAQSLPPDPGSKKRFDAVEASRQYTEWLTELAHGVGLQELSITPHRRTVSVKDAKDAYVEVVVKIDGAGRLSQLFDLLDRFYRTDLLQRIGRLQVTTEDVLGDPPVKFSLEAAGLALSGAPVRRTLFAKTSLATDLELAALQLTVTNSQDFPKPLPFRVRVERELLEVTEADGNLWTVRRGMERTEKSEHPAKTPLTLVPIRKSAGELSLEAFREMVRTNVFVKPTPPVNYEPTFGPFPAAVAVRGKTLELTLAARDYDPALGEPRYVVDGTPPPGLTLDEEIGKLVWKPDPALPAGEYPLSVAAIHPSAPGGRLTEDLVLRLVEPNSPPKVTPIAPQSVYRGQTFRVLVEATDQESPPQILTFRLAAGSPPGCRIDAARGELTWTPGDDQPIGPATIAVSVSDNGTPAQTSTASMIVDVKEDAAQSTRLIGIVGINQNPEAWFYDQATEKKTVLRIGDVLRSAEIRAEITGMTAELVTVRVGDAESRLKLGDTVRSLTKRVLETSPAGSPDQ